MTVACVTFAAKTGQRWAATLYATIVLLVGASLSGSAQIASEPALKAAFVFNFAKFAEWPGDVLPASSPLVLCVTDGPTADALAALVNSQAVGGHQLTVRRVGTGADLRACHLVYVAGPDPRSTQLLAAVRDASVLTIGDCEPFASLGGVAQLFVEDKRVRFAVNMTALRRARLKLSSKLLSLATVLGES